MLGVVCAISVSFLYFIKCNQKTVIDKKNHQKIQIVYCFKITLRCHLLPPNPRTLQKVETSRATWVHGVLCWERGYQTISSEFFLCILSSPFVLSSISRQILRTGLHCDTAIVLLFNLERVTNSCFLEVLVYSQSPL